MRWKCPMCGDRIKEATRISVLDDGTRDGTKVCSKCWHHAQGRKTMTWYTFQRLCVCNSPKVPVAEIGGIRKRWVGIGLVDEGPATGKEVLITP